jgi:diaminohydroxyphosphoribosylaminopyrimidine deaminase/5-amino-6-(5-phosphoribosylamino)uracil reductase
VLPNPQVGALIVHQGRIIGEGFHAFLGGPHAEVRALRSVKEKDRSLLSASTMYVSLEPCSHHGKTPPCSLAIVQHRIPRVVIGCTDPNPRVSGAGIQYLLDHGTEVLLTPDPSPFEELNKAFFVNQRENRPFITLKWAESSDGFLAGLNESGEAYPVALTAHAANARVHELRAQHHAILVGRKTASIDNPSLSVRHFYGKNPIRLVLDPNGVLSPHLRVLDGSIPSLVLGPQRELSVPDLAFWQPSQWQDWDALFRELYEAQGICSILVEGGRQILQQLLDQGVWDELYRFVSPKRLGTGVFAPHLSRALQLEKQQAFGPDACFWLRK